MKGYGSNREVKTSKHVSVNKDGKEDEYEEFSGSYNWNDLNGELTLALHVDGKNIPLLKLPAQLYDKVMLSIRSGEEIEEIMQKQLEIKEVSK
jgi:hypothetical protein